MKSPFVAEKLLVKKLVVDALLANRLVIDRLVPVAEVNSAVVEYRVSAVNAVDEAISSVVLPVTLRVEDSVVAPVTPNVEYRLVAPVTPSVDEALRAPENRPVVPVIAPRLAVEEYRLVAVNPVPEAVENVSCPNIPTVE